MEKAWKQWLQNCEFNVDSLEEDENRVVFDFDDSQFGLTRYLLDEEKQSFFFEQVGGTGTNK